MSEIQVRYELVTPGMAAEWLTKHNSRNRPILRSHVRAIMDELEEGRWKKTHQGIAFADDGDLLDGQHRLQAIAESGVSAELLVARGLSRDVFDALDQHRRRTAGQLAAMGGVLSKDASRLTAMARAILQIPLGRTRPSNTAVSEYAIAHRAELEPFLPVARAYAPAVAGAFAWLSTLGQLPQMQAAAKRLLDQAWSGSDDPMRSLARKLGDAKGTGAAVVRERFDLALAYAMVARDPAKKWSRVSLKHDYESIALDLQTEPDRQATIEYDEGEPAPKNLEPPSTSLAAGLTEDEEEAVELELRSRKSPSGLPPISNALAGLFARG